MLLEKGVCESKILFLSLIAAPEGIHKICHTFPRVKVITSEIDGGIGEDYQVIPGEAQAWEPAGDENLCVSLHEGLNTVLWDRTCSSSCYLSLCTASVLHAPATQDAIRASHVHLAAAAAAESWSLCKVWLMKTLTVQVWASLAPGTTQTEATGG